MHEKRIAHLFGLALGGLFRDQSHPECNEHLSGMIPSA